MHRSTEIIVTEDEDTLVGLVMALTGGSANPAVVRHHIRRIKTVFAPLLAEEAKDE